MNEQEKDPKEAIAKKDSEQVSPNQEVQVLDLEQDQRIAEKILSRVMERRGFISDINNEIEAQILHGTEEVMIQNLVLETNREQLNKMEDHLNSQSTLINHLNISNSNTQYLYDQIKNAKSIITSNKEPKDIEQAKKKDSEPNKGLISIVLDNKQPHTSTK